MIDLRVANKAKAGRGYMMSKMESAKKAKEIKRQVVSFLIRMLASLKLAEDAGR